MTLQPLDNWVLARLLAGYDQKPLDGMSHRAWRLANELALITFRNRDLIARNNLTPQEMKAIQDVDTESPMPKVLAKRQPPFRVIPARDLHTLPPVRWIVPGEIPEASLVVVYGESGAGKSFVTIDYALKIAQDRIVAYVPTEGEAGYRKRVAAWCKHHKKGEGSLFFVIGQINLYDRKAFLPLLDELRTLRPALVVIDTLAAASVGADENSARDMNFILRSCRDIIAECGATVLLVHHVGKAGTTERGSGALRGNADVMIRVSPADDVIHLECSKTKDEAPFEPRFLSLVPVALDESEQSMVVISSRQLIKSDQDALTPNQRKLLEVMALAVNRDGIPMRELADITNLSLGSVQRALSNMMDRDYVTKSGQYKITDKGLKALGVEDDVNQRSKNESHESRSVSVTPSDESLVSHESRISDSNSNRKSGDSVIQPIQTIRFSQNDDFESDQTDSSDSQRDSYYTRGG